MKRYHVFVEGRVQGVGMRGFCMMEAQSRGLTGSVKNLENGLVEIYVQGAEELIDLFLAKVKEGNRFIRVDDMSIKEVPVVEGEKRFSYGGW
jgi:Acylphosphatases